MRPQASSTRSSLRTVGDIPLQRDAAGACPRIEWSRPLPRRNASRWSSERPIAELELGARATEALAKAGITKVGQVMEKLELGESSVLAIEGFGRKSLADLKKRLRQLGYQLPEAAEEIKV